MHSLFPFARELLDTESCDGENDDRLENNRNNTETEIASPRATSNAKGIAADVPESTDNLTKHVPSNRTGGEGRRFFKASKYSQPDSKSDWSGDELACDTEDNLGQDDDDEVFGGAESTEGLENISLLNEAGLTDAEGALSDVNSLSNAPDADDTSFSSRNSSRLISMESLSGFYDYELEGAAASSSSFKHGMPIANPSHRINKKL